MVAEAAVVRRRHQGHAHGREGLAHLEVGGGAAAVEDARAAARAEQLFAEEVEGRDAVAAGDEQRLVPGRRRGERPAQRAQALREVAGGERGQRARAGPIVFRNRRKVSLPDRR